MMSYLWILLLGSLLASHGKAQDDETTPDVVDTEAAGELEVTTDAGTDDANSATEPPAADSDPDPEPEANTDPSEGDAATPAPSDSDETTPSEDAQPAAEAGEGDAANDATEAPVVEEAEATTVAADPEAAEPADAETTPAPEPEVPAVVDTETEAPTPGDALIETTVGDGILTTQGAGSGLDVEPEQTTQSVEKEVPVVTDAPAIQVEAGGDEKTTPEPIQEEATLVPLIQEPEIGVKVHNEVKAEKGNDEFDLLDAVDDEPTNKGQRKLPNFNAEPVKEGEKTSTQEGSSKPLAAVLSAIVVSAVGAVTGYFAYQKKKLCFKNRGDPETGNNTPKAAADDAQSEPQVHTNLLPTTQQ